MMTSSGLFSPALESCLPSHRKHYCFHGLSSTHVNWTSFVSFKTSGKKIAYRARLFHYLIFVWFYWHYRAAICTPTYCFEMLTLISRKSVTETTFSHPTGRIKGWMWAQMPFVTFCLSVVEDHSEKCINQGYRKQFQNATSDWKT